jgi:hypothetical protein
MLKSSVNRWAVDPLFFVFSGGSELTKLEGRGQMHAFWITSSETYVVGSNQNWRHSTTAIQRLTPTNRPIQIHTPQQLSTLTHTSSPVTN